ncbi:MAG TPA: pyridoxamine 5'-phosphate oxidase [Albitalea sp.]|nr:pyridoxamine 5'-phosphate oxidase [Albitalea sp.]
MRRARLATLETIEAAVWDELAGCIADKSHPWRTPVLATVDGHGAHARADARTVVLRELDAARRELRLYGDARAAKVDQLRAAPHGTLVMWSPALGWQLRCRVILSIQTEGPEVAARWARLARTPAAQDYLSPLPPGARLDTIPAEPLAREHFAVVTARVTMIDWLELHADGHRRASFSAGRAHWLQP